MLLSMRTVDIAKKKSHIRDFNVYAYGRLLQSWFERVRNTRSTRTIGNQCLQSCVLYSSSTVPVEAFPQKI